MLAIPRRAGLLALWVAILGSASAGELDPKSTKRLALAQEKAEKLKQSLPPGLQVKELK